MKKKIESKIDILDYNFFIKDTENKMQDDSNMDGILAKIETKAELTQTGNDNLVVRTLSLVLVFFSLKLFSYFAVKHQ